MNEKLEKCPSCDYHKSSEKIWRDFAKQKQVEIEALKTFYEDRLEAGRKREETLMKTIEALLKKVQEK
jgi:hypothetical protein